MAELDKELLEDLFSGKSQDVLRKLMSEDEYNERKRAADLLETDRWSKLTPRKLNNLKNLKDVKSLIKDPESLSHPWDSILVHTANELPTHFNSSLELVDGIDVIDTRFRSSAIVIVADCEGQFMHRSVEGRSIIAIDRERTMLMALFLCLSMRRGRFGALMSSWILMHLSLKPSEPFPEIETLALITWHDSKDLFVGMLQIVLTFIVGHEIGHEYVSDFGQRFAQIEFFENVDKDDLSRWGEWHALNFDTGLKANTYKDDRGVDCVVLPDEMKPWLEEFSCDIFAGIFSMVNRLGKFGNSEKIDPIVLWKTDAALCQVIMFLGQAAEGKSIKHPAFKIRFEIFYYHAEQIFEDPRVKHVLPNQEFMKKLHDCLWNEGTSNSIEAAQLIFYQLIDPIVKGRKSDRMHGFVKGDLERPADGHAPSLFQSLWWDWLGPQVELAAPVINAAHQDKRINEMINEIFLESGEDYTSTWLRHTPEFSEVIDKVEDLGKLLNSLSRDA